MLIFFVSTTTILFFFVDVSILYPYFLLYHWYHTIYMFTLLSLSLPPSLSCLKLYYVYELEFYAAARVLFLFPIFFSFFPFLSVQ